MNILQSIILGIVQGATEFLPVSSSGHLAILQNIFGMNTDAGLVFDVMLHLGTLIAVCIIFHKDIAKLFVAGIQMVIAVVLNIKTFIMTKAKKEDGEYIRVIDSAYKKFVALILVTTIPTGILGVVLKGFVKTASATLLVPGICLVITAIILLISDIREPGKKKVKKTSYVDAALVGVAQGVAVLPGISRSGSTITACMLLGFDRAFAVKYSFIASIPAILGANILELRHLGDAAAAGAGVASCLIGTIVAGVVGFVCIKVMMYIVKERKFQYFAYYCAIIGVVSIIAYFVKG